MKYLIKHLHTVNKHRWEVFKLSCRVGIPFRGLVHDLSKYSYEELSESVKYYKKSKGKYSPLAAAKKDIGYSRAWLHHFGRNKHHYEYWYDYTAPTAKPIIPFKYMLEMICDRIAASKVYYKDKFDTSIPYQYFKDREDTMMLNDNLKLFLSEVLLKYKEEGNNILKKDKIYKIYLKYTKKES